MSAAPTAEERRLLRSLAARVRAIADDPSMPARRRRLAEHNALRGDRPLVLCFPEGAWSELVPDASLRCAHPLLRRWERWLRERITWWDDLRDDGALDPVLPVAMRVAISGFGVDIPLTHGADRGSYAWEPPLANLDRDLARLRPRTIAIDEAGSRADLELAWDLVGDVLPPRLTAGWFWTHGLTADAIRLYGMEPLLAALAEDPAGVERLLGFLRDDMLGLLDQIDAAGAWTPNWNADVVGSGGYGCSDELPGSDFSGRIGCRHRWGFAESQETVGVGPRMFARHILPFQLPILERFGLNCYGCCEPVHQRLDAILAGVPRLRRLSVSPWADQERVAERIGGRVIFSRKPNPALVCAQFAEDAIRADFARTAALADRCRIEIVLKDTHTIQHQPWRLQRWLALAYAAIGARETAPACT